jgi:nitric-oxide synthase, bacterial
MRWLARRPSAKADPPQAELTDPGAGDADDRMPGTGELLAAAERFLALFHAENPEAASDFADRMRRVRAEVTTQGTYRHTPEELAFAARVAWRNSSRCIGRLYWRTLRVRDRRQVTDADQVAAECATHLRQATNAGRIRPMITVFAPDAPGRPDPRILNSQLIGYAGHEPGGALVGDPAHLEITRLAHELGWRPGDPPGRFDLLPLIVASPGLPPAWFELPQTPCSRSRCAIPSWPGSASCGCAGTQSR